MKLGLLLVAFAVSVLLTGCAGVSSSSSSSSSPSPSGGTGGGTPGGGSGGSSGGGTGTSAHAVNVSWTASASPNISGYNVYRAVYNPAPAGACGEFVKINPTLNTATLYTDSNVAGGTAYCYAATAVDTSNLESSYSNIASNIQIPAN